MTLHKYPNWNHLIGATVEIRQHRHTIRTGTVDDAMADSSALWVASEGVLPRGMYEASLEYEAWVEPRQLAGTSCYRMTSSMLYPNDHQPQSMRYPNTPAAGPSNHPEFSGTENTSE